MNNRKKVLLILIGMCIIFLLFFIVQIYAKYLTATDLLTSLTLANWNILVNNYSIKNNTDISNSIVPVFPGNEHIAAGIIAPTAEGYFDLNFDVSEVDVSFKYEITVSPDENSSVADLVVTAYSIDDNEKIELENYNDSISETITYSSNIDTRKVRIFLKWDDDDTTQSMTNSEDTLSTLSDKTPLLHVNVAFTQVTDV